MTESRSRVRHTSKDVHEGGESKPDQLVTTNQ
jgi:hypothetical protein